jgi:hypothetical protein
MSKQSKMKFRLTLKTTMLLLLALAACVPATP